VQSRPKEREKERRISPHKKKLLLRPELRLYFTTRLYLFIFIYTFCVLYAAVAAAAAKSAKRGLSHAHATVESFDCGGHRKQASRLHLAQTCVRFMFRGKRGAQASV